MNKSFSGETRFILVLLVVSASILAGILLKNESTEESDVKLDSLQSSALENLEARVAVLEAKTAAPAPAPAPAR